MEDKDFLDKMENINKPEFNTDASRRQIKIAMLNAKRSASWGIWFLVVPVFFFGCVAIKYLLNWNWAFAGKFIDGIARLDKSMSFPFVTILLFIVLPAIGVVLNLLAIMHFSFNKQLNELIVTIKLKWLNIILAIISIGIIAAVLLYAIVENSTERAIREYDVEWQKK
jgi:hypothetical protein